MAASHSSTLSQIFSAGQCVRAHWITPAATAGTSSVHCSHVTLQYQRIWAMTCKLDKFRLLFPAHAYLLLLLSRESAAEVVSHLFDLQQSQNRMKGVHTTNRHEQSKSNSQLLSKDKAHQILNFTGPNQEPLPNRHSCQAQLTVLRLILLNILHVLGQDQVRPGKSCKSSTTSGCLKQAQSSVACYIVTS